MVLACQKMLVSSSLLICYASYGGINIVVTSSKYKKAIEDYPLPKLGLVRYIIRVLN